MGLIKKFKNVRDNYVKNQVENAVIPQLSGDNMVRRGYVFTGRVQHVGFRLEVEQLAKRLELTGWIKNCDNGAVEMEIQGPAEHIDFLVDFMSNLKRIKINNFEMSNEPVVPIEQMFLIL